MLYANRAFVAETFDVLCENEVLLDLLSGFKEDVDMRESKGKEKTLGCSIILTSLHESYNMKFE